MSAIGAMRVDGRAANAAAPEAGLDSGLVAGTEGRKRPGRRGFAELLTGAGRASTHAP